MAKHKKIVGKMDLATIEHSPDSGLSLNPIGDVNLLKVGEGDKDPDITRLEGTDDLAISKKEVDGRMEQHTERRAGLRRTIIGGGGVAFGKGYDAIDWTDGKGKKRRQKPGHN
ncbi:MAG: hypothetical protein V1703_03700 [Candidatus Altiarchaeota archaeon]